MLPLIRGLLGLFLLIATGAAIPITMQEALPSTLKAALTITSNGDRTPPTCTKLTVSKNGLVDVTAGPATATVTATCTDNVRISIVSVAYVSPNGQQVVGTGDCQKNGNNYVCTLLFPARSQPGEWTVQTLLAIDGNKNFRVYTNKDVVANGWVAKLTVTSPTPDITPPELTKFVVEPTTFSLDVNNMPDVAINASIEATDIGGVGVQSVAFWLRSPNGKTEVTGVWIVDEAAAITASGVFVSRDIFLPITDETSGPYRLFKVVAADGLGNEKESGYDALKAAGFTTDFTVNVQKSTTAPPVLVAVSTSPASLRLTSTPVQPLQVAITVEGDVRANQFAWCRLFMKHTSTGEFVENDAISVEAAHFQSYNATDQTSRLENLISLPINVYSGGAYSLAGAKCADAMGNTRLYGQAPVEPGEGDGNAGAMLQPPGALFLFFSVAFAASLARRL